MSIPTNPPIPPKRGGPDFHKPGCKCNACVARRRKAEAVADGVRLTSTAVVAVEPIEADQETILTDLPKANRNVRRAQIKKWLMWKSVEPDLTHKDAAKRLGIATQTLTNTIHIATKEGWLKFEDPLNELRYEIMPMVTHNLKYYLQQGDKDVTVKTAQGTLFKQFLDAEGIKEAPTNVLAIKIERAENALPTVGGGKIVGKARTLAMPGIAVIDGEVE